MTKNVFKKIAALVIMAVMVVTAVPAVSTAVTAKADEEDDEIKAAIQKATATKIRDFYVVYDNGFHIARDTDYEDSFISTLNENKYDKQLMVYQLQIKPVAKVHYKKDGKKNQYVSSITKLTNQKSQSYLSSDDMRPSFDSIRLRKNLIYSVRMRRKVTFNGQTSYSPWTKKEYSCHSVTYSGYTNDYDTSDTRAGDFKAKNLGNEKVKLTITSHAEGWDKKGNFYYNVYHPSVTIKA